MKILRLSSENVKRLRAVEIRPDGNCIVIGGRNGQGKSSVLDSIVYALGGKGAVPSRPIRDGEEKAEIVVELDDLIVTRRFTSAGSTLTVANREGAKFATPQAMLDKLVGRLSFDPLAFSRMKVAEQAQTLRELVGLDTAELDHERAMLYDHRRDVNRDAKQLEARAKAAPRYTEAPAEEVSVADLMTERKKRAAARDAREAMFKQSADADMDADRFAVAVEHTEREIRRLETLLAEAQKLRGDQRAAMKRHIDTSQRARAAADAMDDPDLEEVDNRIEAADTLNDQVRANRQAAELDASLAKLQADAGRLTEQIEDIDSRKASMLSSADYPIDGLAIDAEGMVTFNGLPFDQCSAAEQLRVSVAMGLAMNPDLRVLLIRDGSLLDAGSLAMVAEMATKHDAQVWIERVGDGDATAVVIEDGSVREAVAAEPALA